MTRMTSGKVGAWVALGLLTTGCSGGGGEGGSGTGTISLAIMDAPVYDATQVWVTFTGVSLKPQGAGPAIDIELPGSVQVDLLSLNADNAETLLDSYTVPAGHYNWLELEVSTAPMASYAVLQNGGVEPVTIDVPSGSVRLVSGLTITADQETSFLIDWNLHKGLVDPVGQPGLLLRPALRVIDMTQYGTLTGVVQMPLVTAGSCANDLSLDIGNAVYIYAGHGVTPDDFDATDPDPVASTAVTQNQVGDYVYETLLSPGPYTVAFTCQAINDLPESSEEIVFAPPANIPPPANITIVDGEILTVDF